MDADNEIEEWLLLPSSDISETEEGNEDDEVEPEDVAFNRIFSKELERQLGQNNLLNESMMEEVVAEDAVVEDGATPVVEDALAPEAWVSNPAYFVLS